jgi:nucleotide-binding universal stress UspA family protein
MYSQDAKMYGRRGGSDDSLYNSGKRALDEHRWDQALDRFSEVASRGGEGADGALYWKAYSLDRLARRDEALATIAELRKAFPNSRWLDDAKALEVEVRQASGKPSSPETENDDEIKLLALNGLMQSDPDRAFPILENLLKSAQAPRLKKRTLFVLAENGSPRAQQLLERIARGNANPDLQLEAIEYMSVLNRKQSGNGQVLSEIYAASNDAGVKRAVIRALVAGQMKDRLLQIARSEKDPDLRVQVVHMLPAFAAQPEMWQLYQAETVPEVKKQILHAMAATGNSDKLLEVARTDKDPGVRRSAIQDLTMHQAPNTGEALAAIYSAEQDKEVKRAIVSTLFVQKNVKAMVELGRKESDPEMKRHIVQLLAQMKSPEATEFLEEILK